jgi:hypothetical protein
MVTVKGLTTLGAALAVCIALGAATMWAAPGSRPPHRAAVHRSGEFGFGAALPCGEGQSPIYFVPSCRTEVVAASLPVPGFASL